MRRYLLASVLFLGTLLICSSDSVRAQDDDIPDPVVTFTFPESLDAIYPGYQFNIQISVSMDERLLTIIERIKYSVFISLSQVPATEVWVDATSPVINTTMVYTLTAAEVAQCNGTLVFPASALVDLVPGLPGSTYGLGVSFHFVPCTVLTSSNLDLLGQTSVCGANNDIITGLENPPAGIQYSPGTWEGNQRTVTATATGHRIFASGTSESRTFTDTGPCTTSQPEKPIHTEVCGSKNDVVTVPDQPANILVQQSTQWSDTNTWTVTFSAAENYVLPGDDETPTYTFTDTGPCQTSAPETPIHTEVCGSKNDVVTVPDQPANILVQQSTQWSDTNTWTVTFSAVENYVLPGDDETPTYTFTDIGPCTTSQPEKPIHTEVCGSKNDVVIVPDQPANILVQQSTQWSDTNTWTVTFSAVENYVLPGDGAIPHTFTDAADPCPTDAPVPPVQTAICGPDNDLLTIPPQPNGVSVASDSDWSTNSRTIVFEIDPEFATDGETSFAFVDANESCPIITKTVTIDITTSDGGSVEGSPWQLYATTATQTGTGLYAQGTVGAGNTIVLEDLNSGQYRLTVDADGYEPVDIMFIVTDEPGPQQVDVDLTALQAADPSPTPTPSSTSTAESSPAPSPSPTPSPSPSATVSPESSVEPTAAAVTGLPDTGKGASGSGGIIVLISLLGAVILVIGIRHHKVA